MRPWNAPFPYRAPSLTQRVDAAGALLHTAVVPSLETDNQRRSSRVFTRIPVRASGRDVQGRKFRENSQTIVVNAHGGLLYLNETLGMGAQLTLTNPVTEEEQECRIVYLGDTSEKGQRVGVEFLSPAPRFWGVAFAPSDWPARPAPAPPS
jgi:hypothetical protein